MEEPPTRSSIRRMYDRIAEHFAATRSRPWPEVTEFVEGSGPVDRALDIGCGNGRHAAVLLDIATEVVGLDPSRALLDIARENPEVAPVRWIQGDALALPLAAGSVDLALYIATIHHLPTRADRVGSLDELARVLRPSGRAMVSAWSVSHEKFDASAGHDRIVPWTLPSGEEVARYYHLYDLDEFDADLRESALSVERSYEASGNCYGIVGASAA